MVAPTLPTATSGPISSALTVNGSNPKPMGPPPPQPPTPEEMRESARNIRLGIASGILAVGVALATHSSLTRGLKSGQVVAFCQKLDSAFPWLNKRLNRLTLPGQHAACDKLFTRTPTATVIEDTLKQHIQGVLEWASTHLPKAHAAQWQDHLNKVKTLDDLTMALKPLRATLGQGEPSALALAGQVKQPQKALDMLTGLEKRIVEGMKERYFEPYRLTRERIHQSKLGPVGQTMLHFLQSVQQLSGGDFASQTLGKKPGKLAPLFNGLLIFSAPVYALLQSEPSEKLKRFGEELWGNAFGNFVGWYWGAQWLNHWGIIPKLLNRWQPGLATKPILGGMATPSGFITELVAVLGIGSLIAQLGTKGSHLVLGTPRKPYTPKLPPNYTPIQRHLTLSQDTPLPQDGRIAQLTDQDLTALMTNPHAVHERKRIDKLQPQLNDLLAFND